MKALTLHPREPEAVTAPADRGRMMNAAEVADVVWERKVSAKWVRSHMREIGFKAGREMLWHENEARQWRDRYIEIQRDIRRTGT